MTKKPYKQVKKEEAKEEPKEISKENNDFDAPNDSKNSDDKLPPMPLGMPPLSKEAQEKLKQIKDKLEQFKKKVIEKFDKYISGIALLPPEKPKEGEKPDMNKINVLVLVDDSDSKNMSKQELKSKLATIIDTIAQEVDKNIYPQTIIFSELWQSCYDAKYDLLQLAALSAPIHDTGMLSAVKIAEVHKSMVLKKFEKYIVTYVLSGSLIRGQATPTSDIDVFIVIDDTDVKRMTRAELKDKLRAIIIGMGIEAGEITGIKNKLNIQVYILTDFWDSLKEANPIIFTLLRDGVPFFDRGIFMPWKQLLRMGKIKPSMEAIDMFMNSGEQMLKRVGFKVKEIGMEDTYYAILTPSQAALMLYGIPPPAPRETAQLLREVFVKKEKLLEEEYVKILEANINVRKELEHGTKENLSGKELDKLLSDADKFLKRVKKLFTQIELMKEKESIVHIYETVVTVVRDILRVEGIEKVKDAEILSIFESEMIHKGLIPQQYHRMLDEIIKAKKDYDIGKLGKTEVEQARKTSGDLIKFLVEYMQRKRGRELERTKVRVKHGNRYGEVLLLDNTAFIIHDIDHKEKEISKAIIKPDGSLGTIESSNLEELEKHLAKIEILPKVFIKEPIFENLKNIFGKDVEILINY
ncbi:nucleotidyltransferase domain-containing protein [Candidatus Woesearchaeota archaeon]|nr:nucleotidyltransferase domain-containing protein [Candidatus Woesearchaeota archaeon]